MHALHFAGACMYSKQNFSLQILTHARTVARYLATTADQC